MMMVVEKRLYTEAIEAVPDPFIKDLNARLMELNGIVLAMCARPLPRRRQGGNSILHLHNPEIDGYPSSKDKNNKGFLYQAIDGPSQDDDIVVVDFKD